MFLSLVTPYYEIQRSNQTLSLVVGNVYLFISFPFQEFASFLRVLGCYPMDTVL